MKYQSIRNSKWFTIALFNLCFTISIFAQFAPPSSVIINEVSYRTETPGDFTEYIELHNTTSSPVNIGGWFIDDAVSYQIPANTTIQGNGYVIIAQNINDFNAHFNNNGSTVLGPWSGALRNSGEDIILRDASFDRVDLVDYDNWNEWPSTGHLEDANLSLQLVNVNLPGNHGGSWAAAAHTPGAFNSAVYINNPNERPIIQNVRRSPDTPLSTEDVRVRTEIDIDNLALIPNLQIKLEYKVLLPGSEFEHKDHPNYDTGWTVVDMLDDGIGADSTASNGVFTALIPSSEHQHRSLIRYRVKITNGSGFSATYPDPNYDESNYAYYIYNGYPAEGGVDLTTLPVIQDLTIFSDFENTRRFIGSDVGEHGPNGQYQGTDSLGYGAVIYDGRVYDHIQFRPRGSGSRLGRVKPGIRVRMNREHSFETQNDCGQTYDVDRGRLVLSGGWVHDQGGHGLTESLIYKILELTGSIERHVNYTQLRVVDDQNQSATSTQKGDFWGLYLILEDYNGDLLDEHSRTDEGNFWNTSVPILPGGTLPRQRDLDYQGHFPDSELIEPWAEPEFFNNPTGRKFMDNELDLEMMFADRIANVIYGQHGNNYIGKHSYREYYNSVTGKYVAWWADMDNSFGAAQGDQEDNWVFTRNQLDPNVHLKNDIFIDGSQQIDYQNAMRCIYDLLVNGDHDNSDPTVDPYEQIDFLVDQERSLIHTYGSSADWMQVDQARWGHVYDATNGPSPNTADAHVEWYKQWFRDRAAYMEMNDGPHPLNVSEGSTTPDHIFDPLIPNTPTITKPSASNAIDELDFTNSSFSDPQGANTFAALEWRIAEWSDPSNPFYNTRCRPHYEIESVWESGEILTDSTSFSFDDATQELQVGRTYKVRMRHKDDSGRWSHWSDAITFIADDPVTPTEDNIVISEIHYNPARSCAEFIELYNSSNGTINLANYKFSDGVNFTFPIGTFIGPGEYKIVVDNEDCFIDAFGNNPNIIGQYSGGLDNGGEEIKLESPIGTRLDSVNYDDVLPWDTLADNGLHSLALIDLTLDNDIAVNWATQCVSVTPGAPNDFNGCNTLPDLSALVINEIRYDGGPNNLEFIELKNTGTTPVDIQGLQVSGVELQILESHIIPPGGFIILAEDTASAALHFQVPAPIQFPGRLANSGESIILTDFFGNEIDVVTYGNSLPWPLNAVEMSIGLIDCNFDNDSPVNWAAQDVPFTPAAENSFGPNVLPDYSDLEINELHFNPANSSDEFVELVNKSPLPIFLADLHFEGFDFTFSDSDVIFPNSYFVIARFNNDYINAYGSAPNASWEGAGGGLDDGGENLRLLDLFGNEVDRVPFDDIAPWDTRATDGEHSLALKLNASDNSLAANWSIQCDFVTPKAVNNFDTDDDSICDDLDVCAGLDDALIGQSCNDGDPCTTNDVYTSNCLCEGTFVGDADSDGFCDTVDHCPNFDDNLLGATCDDGDPCTPTSIYTNCNCEAVENAALGGIASMSSQFSSLAASRLNNDRFTGNNELAHTGGSSPNEWFEIDLGSDMQISSVVLWNRINCCSSRINNVYIMVADTPFPANTDLTQSLTNSDYTHQLGDETDSAIIAINLNTSGRYIRIQKSGNNDGRNFMNLRELQVFTPVAIVDTDNDGVCDIVDQCPNFDDNLIGQSCDDNDPCTSGDVYTSTCDCVGTVVADSDGDGVCNAIDQCPNFDDNLIGQPCDDGIICFVGSTWDANCNCSGGAFSDLDNDNVCDPLDQCPGFDDNVDVNNNGIPDGCEGCADYIVESTNSIISIDRSANINITTNGRVFVGDIEYHAGQEVNLTEGFEVKAGAVFHAYIAPCN